MNHFEVNTSSESNITTLYIGYSYRPICKRRSVGYWTYDLILVLLGSNPRLTNAQLIRLLSQYAITFRKGIYLFSKYIILFISFFFNFFKKLFKLFIILFVSLNSYSAGFGCRNRNILELFQSIFFQFQPPTIILFFYFFYKFFHKLIRIKIISMTYELPHLTLSK
jgi:hypothetical protein